jgi:hypothetical protein
LQVLRERKKGKCAFFCKVECLPRLFFVEVGSRPHGGSLCSLVLSSTFADSAGRSLVFNKAFATFHTFDQRRRRLPFPSPPLPSLTLRLHPPDMDAQLILETAMKQHHQPAVTGDAWCTRSSTGKGGEMWDGVDFSHCFRTKYAIILTVLSHYVS